MRHSTLLTGCAVLCYAAITTLPLQAAIVLSDSFSYGGTGGILSGVTATGSTGFTGNWSFSTGAQYWSYNATGGLTFGAYGGTGGAATFTQSNFSNSVVQRQLTSALGTGTFYASHLFSVAAVGNDGSVSAIGFGNSGVNSNSAPVIISTNEFGSGFVGGSRVGGTVSINAGTRADAASTTYLSLASFSLSGASITITRYILNQAQFDNFSVLPGGLDGNLNLSLATGTAANQVMQRGTQTVSNATTSLPFLVMEGYPNNATYTFTYDEMRLSDLGFNEVVPEPSTALLVLAGLGSIICRRRFREA